MKNSIDISKQAQGAMAYTGVSITELAERSGIGRDNLRGYVNGKCKCRPEYISALADALDVTDEYLMGYTGFEPHLWRNRRSEKWDCQDNTPNCIAIPHEVDPNVTAAQLIREKFPVEPLIRAYSVEVDGEWTRKTSMHSGHGSCGSPAGGMFDVKVRQRSVVSPAGSYARPGRTRPGGVPEKGVFHERSL